MNSATVIGELDPVPIPEIGDDKSPVGNRKELMQVGNGSYIKHCMYFITQFTKIEAHTHRNYFQFTYKGWSTHPGYAPYTELRTPWAQEEQFW